MPCAVFGIDPGLSGAIALMYPTDPVLVWDMPLCADPTQGKQMVDGAELMRIFQTVDEPFSKPIALLEKVSAMPGQGVTSMFNFGKSYGVIIGVLRCLGIETWMTPPAVWKSSFNLSKDKNLSRARATKEFPRQAHYFERKKDDGRAEAALLALYGVKHFYPHQHGRFPK